jgi:hypothetical protein
MPRGRPFGGGWRDGCDAPAPAALPGVFGLDDDPVAHGQLRRRVGDRDHQPAQVQDVGFPVLQIACESRLEKVVHKTRFAVDLIHKI